MNGGFYWVDSARRFVVIGRGEIWYSADGGNRFKQVRGTEPGLSSSIRMTSDGEYLYLAGVSNDMARYRIDGLSSTPSDSVPRSLPATTIKAIPNVVSRVLRLECGESNIGLRNVRIYDPLGNVMLNRASLQP